MGPHVPVRRLFESHLTVSDLQRSVSFYRGLAGLTLALEIPERNAAFFWVGEAGDSLLGLWSLGSSPLGITLHVAFEVTIDDLLDAPKRLESQSITPLSFFGAETTEPNVIGWMPAAALYFLTPMAICSNISRCLRRIRSWISGSFPGLSGLPRTRHSALRR